MIGSHQSTPLVARRNDKDCMKVYDESEYAKCPFCSDNKDEYTHVIVFDKKAGVAKAVPKEDAHLYE